jgi:hypothetical protein
MKRKKNRADFWADIFSKVHLDKQKEASKIKGNKKWIKVRVKNWLMCQYCLRNIFSKERAYKLEGSKYIICKQCFEKIK